MSRPFIYRILEIPAVYRLCTQIAAPGALKLAKPIFDKQFGKVSGVVLDLGCGPNPTAPFPDGTLVGVDVNSSYLSSYIRSDRSRMGEIRTSATQMRGVVADAMKLPFMDSSFDECRALAIFHHLDDQTLEKSLKECYRVLKPGGRLVFFDAILPDKIAFRILAYLTLQLDRGEFFRKQVRLQALLEKAAGTGWRVNRFTYTYTGIEGVIGILIK